MRAVSVVASWLVLVLLAFAAPGFAQVSGSQVPPEEVVVVEPHDDSTRTFGTASQVAYTVRIQDFLPPDSSVTWATDVLRDMHQTSTSQIDWWANLFLPAGAIVDRVEMEACDSTSTGQTLFGLAQFVSPGVTGFNVTPVGATGTAETPGCALFSVTPSSTLQIDNNANSYLLFADWQGDFTSSNRITAFRVFYRLAVSPAPAVATFTDVPTTHQFYQFVEALAASGITGGCATAPLRYCPNDPVTRGQMAVFLSRALGLHFAP